MNSIELIPPEVKGPSSNMVDQLANDGGDSGNGRIKLSVIVCTYRRYAHLKALMSKLQEISGKREDTEILVVDNIESCDEKDRFYSSVELSKNSRVVNSFPPGLARARNAGLEAVRGSLVAYLDDDTQPSPGWLDGVIATFETFTDAAAVAGPIFPIWPIEGRPRWLPRVLEGYLTILDLGDEVRILADHEYAYGANISFRTECLKAVGGFPEHLGRVGAVTLLSNEELEAQRELRRKGLRVYYTPHAAVFHHIASERLSPGWFRRRMAWQVASGGIECRCVENTQEIVASLRQSAARLGISSSVLNAFKETADPRVLEAQIKFIAGLMSLALLSSATVPSKKTLRLRRRGVNGSTVLLKIGRAFGPHCQAAWQAPASQSWHE